MLVRVAQWANLQKVLDQVFADIARLLATARPLCCISSACWPAMTGSVS